MTNVIPIYHIGLIQAWFAALLVYRKPNKGSADRLLVVWLIVIGIEMLYSLLNAKYLTWLPDLIIIPLSYGPFLFFYTKLLTSKKPTTLRNIHRHLIPVYLFILIAAIWGKPIDIDSVNFYSKGPITWLAIFNYALFLIVILYYWRASLVLIRKHNRTLGDHFSYRSETIMLNWVKNIAIWILSGFFASGITFIIFSTQNIFPFNPIELFHLGLLVFTFSISYYGIHQPVLYQYKKPKHIEANEDLQTKTLQKLGDLLYEHMVKNKPYLNNELTIQDLADQLKVSSQEISSYLNKELGVNFFNYINGFRIEEAKQRLTNPNFDNETLLGIAYDSGFNSKTSFNTLFKKETGMTPSEYKKAFRSSTKKNT
ncbi:MAG: AraC family transcriptional regulator [Bacteroidota bacterium]